MQKKINFTHFQIKYIVSCLVMAIKSALILILSKRPYNMIHLNSNTDFAISSCSFYPYDKFFKI